MSKKFGEIFTNDGGKIEITQFCGPNKELKLQISRELGSYMQLSPMEALYLVDHLIRWLDGKIETDQMNAFIKAGKITTVEYIKKLEE